MRVSKVKKFPLVILLALTPTSMFAKDVTLPDVVLANAKVASELLKGNLDADKRWNALTEEERQDSEVFRGFDLSKEDHQQDPAIRYHMTLFSISEIIQCVLAVDVNKKTQAVSIVKNGYECSLY